MRKTLVQIPIFLLMLLTGCSSANKVTVIKGPGQANSSMMISFNEFCQGKVEGFSGESLILSRNIGNNMEFYIVDSKSKEVTQLLTAPFKNDYYFRISKDGKKFLYENYLVDIEKNKSEHLPEAGINMPYDIVGVADYSFINESEVILSNPFYYIEKYYSDMKKSIKKVSANTMPVMLMKTGDIKSNIINPRFNNIKIPDIDYIENGELLSDQLKYVFIGYRDGQDDTQLYAFDFFIKEFQLVDSNVESYSIAPNNKTMAYIKKETGDKPLNRLIVMNLDGKDRKELVAYESITGMAWSSDGKWIAYSGGERNKRDVYIININGSGTEQLTQGMNPAGVVAWSKTGKQIAFSSGSDLLDDKKTAYMIKLNLKTVEANESPVNEEERIGMANSLKEIIRMETDVHKRKIKS